jgi:division protein CdvB (Snf7/Vps24/ESCRT-III family)
VCPPPSIPHLPERKADENMQAIQQGHNDIAKIYAQNAIRKQNERLNLLRLGSRIDAVASRVQTAVTMRQVTGSMMNVVKGMDQAMKAMDLEKVCPPPLFTALYRQDCFGADRRCRSQQ